MTTLLSLAAVVLVTVLLVAAAHHRGRRAHTYVCRTCHATFSDPDAAYLHREAMHDR